MVFKLFAILQMYEFSSKSQPVFPFCFIFFGCLRYCKCTSFQANHNAFALDKLMSIVVCDTANVRVFKQITTVSVHSDCSACCLRYCKCTSFQANHNPHRREWADRPVVCDTANVRVFKQITTMYLLFSGKRVVCDTANVRVFKQITTLIGLPAIGR